ncbi:MAG: AAA domain-containing protein [Candidatus Methanoperedens sp.]|nr:AAA domain-containing protein [Candidatus Methanoperedens sp.]
MKDYKKLLEYYIACIEREEINSLTFDLKKDYKKFLTDIFTKEQIFTDKNEQVSLKLDNNNLKDFFGRLTANNHLYYGYPIVITRKGEISPIFFVELLSTNADQDSITLIKGSINPEFNHYILKIKGLEPEETNLIREEIDQTETYSTKLKRIQIILDSNSEILPELSEEKIAIPKNVEFEILNKSIIYYGERTGITRNLIIELNKLKNMPYAKLMSTPINYILNPEKINNLTDGKIKPIIDIFPLNQSQSEAVKNAFLKKITVVTGPPGTGKSQVVLNIIANAIWNNKVILFASKNNRAVDVVNEKLSQIIPKNLIMRMGNRENRRETKSSLIELLQNKEYLGEIKDIYELQAKLETINSKIEDIKNRIKELSQINTLIDENLKTLSNFSKNLPSDLLELGSFKPLSLDRFALENDVITITSELSFLNKLIRLIYPSYFRNRNYKIFKNYYDGLSEDYKKYFDKHIQLNDIDIIKSLNWLLCIIHISICNEENRILKVKLRNQSSLFEYEVQIKKLENEKVPISRDILKSVWFGKMLKIEPSDENNVHRYIDTTEKLEKYHQKNVYFSILSEQIKSFEKIKNFFSAWVVTNLSAKNSFPLHENLFDILVIDEASQCDIPSALPLLFRAKNVIIIGDPKQLKNITTLNENIERKLANSVGVEEFYVDFSYCKNSLYDIFERTIRTVNEPVIFLNEHYRCHKDIISYSNIHFYGEKLNILTDEAALFSDEDLFSKGISWVNVKGKTLYKKSVYNIEEIKEVIKLLKTICNKNKKISIGIVTLFKEQMDLIFKEIVNEPTLEKMDITVGTAHKFQGGEKDIIIFSPAISEGVKDKTLNWINSTTQLLNVAVTRAKSSLIIVGDFDKCLNEKGFLKSLAEYYNHIQNKKEITFDSGIEKILFDELRKRKINVIPQYNVTVQNKKQYRLDFALFVNQKKFDIEIDGAKAHQNKAEYDSLRDTHLHLENWCIRRYPAYNVQNNLEEVVNDISRLC